MATCKKILFFSNIIIIFFFISNYVNSSNLGETFKEKKISYLEFILNNLENKILLKSKSLVNAQYVVIRVQYQSVGSQVQFIDKENEILINIVAVMDQLRYKRKRYKPKLSDCNIVRNIIFFNQYGYGFFQKRNKYLTTEDMKEYFINNFLNNMYLNESEIDDLVDNIKVNIEIISPIKGHNFFCSGNLLQDELM